MVKAVPLFFWHLNQFTPALSTFNTNVLRTAAQNIVFVKRSDSQLRLLFSIVACEHSIFFRKLKCQKLNLASHTMVKRVMCLVEPKMTSHTFCSVKHAVSLFDFQSYCNNRFNSFNSWKESTPVLIRTKQICYYWITTMKSQTSWNLATSWINILLLVRQILDKGYYVNINQCHCKMHCPHVVSIRLVCTLLLVEVKEAGI